MRFFKTSHLQRQKRKGFTLIISVLISSILLSIGLAMFNISLKEALLSSIGKESQTSFFASDSGIECVVYWEYTYQLPPDPPSVFDAVVVAADVPCINTSGANGITVDSSSCAGGICTHNLTYRPGASSDECARISIQKDSSVPSTVIESRGYNTCDTNDPRRTERAIRITQ